MAARRSFTDHVRILMLAARQTTPPHRYNSWTRVQQYSDREIFLNIPPGKSRVKKARCSLLVPFRFRTCQGSSAHLHAYHQSLFYVKHAKHAKNYQYYLIHSSRGNYSSTSTSIVQWTSGLPLLPAPFLPLGRKLCERTIKRDPVPQQHARVPPPQQR